ncbi:MAG: tyrosine-protein phosphatase [Cetobacterium sp.]
MVDLHSHILYGVDDGSKSLEESLKLCEEAVKLGYKEIFCTSHYQKMKYENESYNQNFNILKSEIEKANMDLKIHPGNELFLDIDTLMSLEKGRFNKLGDSDYILVEFPKGLILNVKINILKTLIDRGYKPIVAHIERYSDLLENFHKLKELSVKTQFNLSSTEYLLENYRELIQNGEINFAASDAHSINSRNYDLKERLDSLKSSVSEKVFRELTSSNAKKILQDV